MTFADSPPLISPSSPKPGIKISSGERIVTVILGHHRKPGDECIKTLNLDWPCVPCAESRGFSQPRIHVLCSDSCWQVPQPFIWVPPESRLQLNKHRWSFTRQHRVRSRVFHAAAPCSMVVYAAASSSIDSMVVVHAARHRVRRRPAA